jgi:hypothetical protein
MKTREQLALITHKVITKYAELQQMRKDLCGLCMISSFTLYEAMKKNDKEYGTDYKPSLVLGMTTEALHCWVESGGQIYDTTYLQFSNKPVHIGEPTKWHNEFNKRMVATFETFKSVVPDQKPTPAKIFDLLKKVEEECQS